MAAEIQVAIAQRLADIAPSVEDAVVEAVVGKEVAKRSEAIVQALERLTKLEHDFKRIKPDVTTYSSDGVVLTSGFSKEKLEERNKTQQKIDKNVKAINKAMTDGDFSDVYNLNSQKD